MNGAVIFYFSGTGNTAWAVKNLASCLELKGIETKTINIEEISVTDVSPQIKGKKYVGFAYPIYGSQLPKPMQEFLIRFPSLRFREVFSFCTQASFSGDGARVINRFLYHSKPQIKYARHFIMPNNISIEKYGFKHTNNPEIINPILDKAQLKIEEFARDIAGGKSKKTGFNPFSHMLGLLQRIPFEAVFGRLKKSFSIDENKCTKCGKCEKICPMDNISIEERCAIGENCCLCLRCYNYCPNGAVLFRKSPPISVPYQGTDNFLSDIQAVKKRCYHSGKPIPKRSSARDIFVTPYGGLRKGFKTLLFAAMLVAALLFIISNAPLNIAFITSRLIYLAVLVPILLSKPWKLIGKKSGKGKKAGNLAFLAIIALFVLFLFSTTVDSFKDVLSPAYYVSAEVIDIQRRSGRYSTFSYAVIDYGSGERKVRLWGKGQTDLKIGEECTFRIMINSGMAIPSPEDYMQ